MLSKKYSSNLTKFLSNFFNFEQLCGIFLSNFLAFSEQNLERPKLVSYLTLVFFRLEGIMLTQKDCQTF